MKVKTITQYECVKDECENWMEQENFNYNPPRLYLKCSGCDREVMIEAETLNTVKVGRHSD